MLSTIKFARQWGYFLTGILIFGLSNGDNIKTVNQPESGYASEISESNKVLLEKIEKALEGEAFLKISCSNINDLCGKSLKFVEKFYPEMSSVLSLTLTSFIGGTQCQGEEGKTPVYILLFSHQGSISPVFFFKSSEESALFKAVSTFKKDPIDFIKLFPSEETKTPWWMCGEKPLLEKLQKKDIKTEFPFLAKAETVEDLLKIDFDMDVLSHLSDLMPFLLKQVFETLVKPDFKHFALAMDYLENNIIIKYSVEMHPNSTMAAIIKGLNKQTQKAHYLDLSSQECIKNWGCQDYENELVNLEEFNARLNSINKAVEEYTKQTKTSEDLFYIGEQLLAWWNIVYPLVKEVCTFCKDNLTGNFQSYANVKCEQNIPCEAVGFGMFEGKALTNEKLVDALKNFITNTLVERLKEAKKQNLFGSEFIPLLSCVFNKNFECYEGCCIQNVYWTIREEGNLAGKAADLTKKVPLYFAVCKNYLLYADNIGDIKRLIERMNAMKTLTYVSMPECFEKTQVRISDFMPELMKTPVYIDCFYAAKEDPEVLDIKCQMPIWFNFETLKNFSNQALLSPKKNEEIKKEAVKNDEKPVVDGAKN